MKWYADQGNEGTRHTDEAAASGMECVPEALLRRYGALVLSPAGTVQAAALWRLYVSSALRYPWTLVTPNVEAAAVWIPPGGTLGAPAYLESSNPANNVRYERAGFTARDQITIVTGHVVTTMWRPAR